MSGTADITVTGDNRQVTITGKGVLDLTNAQTLRDGLKEAAGTADKVTVDLRDATFIDTAVLEYLARARAAMQGSDRHLSILVSADSHPLYVLNTVGFTEMMDVVVYPSTAEEQTSSS